MMPMHWDAMVWQAFSMPSLFLQDGVSF